MKSPIIDVRVTPGSYSYMPDGKMSNEDYHAAEGISSTGVLVIAEECPKSFRYGEHKETPALLFGTASHAALLEPELFHATYARGFDADAYDDLLTSDKAVQQFLSKNGVKGFSNKSGDVLYNAALEFNPELKIKKVEEAAYNKNEVGERTALKPADYDGMMAMRESILNDPDHAEYAAMLKGAKVETSIICDIKIEGFDDWIRVKVRPDIITKCRTVPDFKTTESASPEKFSKSIFNRGYIVRQAFVIDVLSAFYSKMSGEDVEFKAALLAQEKKAPYIAQMYDVTEAQQAAGRAVYHDALIVYGMCRRNDVWPPYARGRMPVQLPAWANRELGIDEDNQ